MVAYGHGILSLQLITVTDLAAIFHSVTSQSHPTEGKWFDYHFDWRRCVDDGSKRNLGATKMAILRKAL